MMLSPAPATSAAASGPTLRDIHLPPPPPWWPPAPGWWLLALLLLLVLFAAAWYARQRRRLHRRRQQWLDELEYAAQRHRQDGNDAALAAALHQQLRRVARQHDAAATQQRGEPWRQTLARVPVTAATLEPLLTLEQAMYRPTSYNPRPHHPTPHNPATGFDAAATLTAMRTWLRQAARPRAWKALAAESTHV